MSPAFGLRDAFMSTFAQEERNASEMATMRIDKIDAARQQIEAAVRLLFENENQIGAHTLAAAGSQIVRDLCEARKIAGFKEFEDWIKPEHVKGFWQIYNRSANFFKHADKDGDATYEFNPEETDYVLLFAIKWYHDLGAALTGDMVAYMYWFGAGHPNIIKDGADFGPLQLTFNKMKDFLGNVDRAERLELGAEALARAKRFAPRINRISFSFLRMLLESGQQALSPCP